MSDHIIQNTKEWGHYKFHHFAEFFKNWTSESSVFEGRFKFKKLDQCFPQIVKDD